MKIVLLNFLFCLVALCSYGQAVSAMTFNIRYDNPKDGDNWWQLRSAEAVKLINYYSPDFLGVQEALNSQVEYISDNCKQYKFIGVGRDDGKKKGEYTALYYNSSRFKLIKESTFWLSDTPDNISVGWDASMERICTYGQFVDKITKQEYYVFNAHFDHRGPLARENSAKLIVQKIRDLSIEDENIIVMGDFNCRPIEAPITAFKMLLDDAGEISQSGIYGPVGTFNKFDTAYIPDGRIDYLFSKNLKVSSYRNIDDRRINNLWPSDHLPVMAIFK